jgi:hypothetical protein
VLKKVWVCKKAVMLKSKKIIDAPFFRRGNFSHGIIIDLGQII